MGLDKIVHTLNDLSPLGLIAGLSYIIYLLVAKRGPMQKLSNNHLHGLPAMESSLEQLVESSKRQEATLADIRDGINYLRGRLNGRSS